MSGTGCAILCNPSSRRALAHAEALARLGVAAPHLIPYRAYLSGDLGGGLSAALPRGATLRIETWGEDWQVERLLLARGATCMPTPSLAEADCLTLAEDFGRYRHQAQHRAGVESMLADVTQVLGARPDVRVLNPPADILVMSDKQACRERLAQQGVPLPAALDAAQATTPDALRTSMRAAGWSQAFIKPRFGSSAAGVIALRLAGPRCVSYSTLELAAQAGETVLYNSLRVRRESSVERIDRLLGPILADGAVIERWIPKRPHPTSSAAMDFRVVCVAGEPMQSVVRTSKSPITNLHLGNARESFADYAALDTTAAALVQSAARQAAAAFPNSVTASVDVLLDAANDRAFVLEVNSFGEFLNDVTLRGETAYESLWRTALAR